MAIFLTVVLSVVFLALWGFVAGTFSDIAADKGHTERRYFWCTFFFGIAGMLMVVALPDRRATPAVQQRNPVEPKPAPKAPEHKDELPDL